MAKSPFSFFSQMANHSQQQNATSFFPLFSPSECIAWLSVFGMDAVAIVTLNALIIIVYLKERSLRKRSMYLVINQAVADMFVGAIVLSFFWTLGGHCDCWTIIRSRNPFGVVINAVCVVFETAPIINLAAISLERTHATFRPFKHRLIKKKIFGAAVAIVWITAGLISTIFVLEIFWTRDLCFLTIFSSLVLPFSYRCFLLVYGCRNCLWKSTSSPCCKP